MHEERLRVATDPLLTNELGRSLPLSLLLHAAAPHALARIPPFCLVEP